MIGAAVEYAWVEPALIARIASAVRQTWALRNGAQLVTRDMPRAMVSGRMQSWRERLNRAVFASRSWEGLEDIARRQWRALNDRAVRASVYQDRAGITGPAVF